MKIQHVSLSEIKFFEQETGQSYTDLPEGTQTITSTLCLVLMRKYAKKRFAEWKPWWKRLLFLGLFLSLLSCRCIPQVPTQYLYVDDSCRAVVDDFRSKFRVYDNCTDHDIVQYPAPGTVLDSPDPFSCDILARDRYGNTTGVTFNVEILDTIAPVLEYVGDTLIVIHQDQDSLDKLIRDYISVRQRLGDSTPVRNFRVWF